jgi:hypothetical protein
MWEKTYGNDMYYRPISIIITQDSGCLISGMRYDSANTAYPGIAENFLLKLDKNGNNPIIGIKKYGESNYRSFTFYPSPAKEKIVFDFPLQESIDLIIMNILGEEIMEIKNYQNLDDVDIRHLLPETYIFRAKTKNGFYTGKFIKE